MQQLINFWLEFTKAHQPMNPLFSSHSRRRWLFSSSLLSTGSLTPTLLFKRSLQFFTSPCEIRSGYSCAEFSGYVIGNSRAYKPVQVWVGISQEVYCVDTGQRCGCVQLFSGNSLPGAERLVRGISWNHLKVQEVPRFQREWRAKQWIW